jgi:hypothetical protein
VSSFRVTSKVTGALQLLFRGFPDAEEERVWQSDVSVTAAKATDRLGVVLQAGICAIATARMWQEGLLVGWSPNWLVYSIFMSNWMWALLRCVSLLLQSLGCKT